MLAQLETLRNNNNKKKGILDHSGNRSRISSKVATIRHSLTCCQDQEPVLPIPLEVSLEIMTSSVSFVKEKHAATHKREACLKMLPFCSASKVKGGKV